MWRRHKVLFIVCSFQKGSLPILYLKKLHIQNADGLASDKRGLVLVQKPRSSLFCSSLFSLQRFVLSRRSSTITEELRREAWQTHLGWLDRRTERTGLKKVWNLPRFWPFWGWDVVWKLWTQWDKTCDVFLSLCIWCPQGPTIDPMVVMLRDFSGFMIWHDKVFFFCHPVASIR